MKQKSELYLYSTKSKDFWLSWK